MDARQATLVYTARHRENCGATHVIVGTFIVNDILYFALVDNGSTHSYFSYVMAEKLVIRVQETISGVNILSPLGQSVNVNNIYK